MRTDIPNWEREWTLRCRDTSPRAFSAFSGWRTTVPRKESLNRNLSLSVPSLAYSWLIYSRSGVLHIGPVFNGWICEVVYFLVCWVVLKNKNKWTWMTVKMLHNILIILRKTKWIMYSYFLYLKLPFFYFYYMCVLFDCINVCHVCAVIWEDRKRCWIPWSWRCKL